MISVLLLTAVLRSCALADLRTEEMLATSDQSGLEEQGRNLLRVALDKVGGRSRFDYKMVEVSMTDEWQGFVGYWLRPWPSNPTSLRMIYRKAGSVECEFIDGVHEGERWGFDQQGSWSQLPGEDRAYAEHEAARFILAAYGYFFELPVRILEAPLIRYAGERERDGRSYSLVFATWGRIDPHEQHDQYLLWIAHDTERIEIAQYTIRDKFDFAQGANVFSRIRSFDGMLVPTEYWISQSLDDSDFVHHVRIDDIRFVR